MENLEFYNKFKNVPDEAKKQILGGKLKGFTDINPMWRIKVLTEVFGPCGTGWKYETKNFWTQNGANGEIAVFVQINLYYKINNSWSEPIEGLGGSMLVTTEKGNLVTNDEAFKMATTDALSVASKLLGVAADVYYEKDRTKYTDSENIDNAVVVKREHKKESPKPTRSSKETLKSIIVNNPEEASVVKDMIDADFGGKKSKDLTEEEAAQILKVLQNHVEDDVNE